MNNRVKVSVLVPIYNVEQFLPECLDSLVGQTLEDIEIICINDGSKDDSLNIIKEYAKNDKRIKVIDKKNSGYGDSMNQGLKKATGEYVGIVESDDFIDLDAFEKLYKIAKHENVEVVKSNFYEYFGDTKTDKAVSNLFPVSEVGRVIDPREEHQIFYQPPCIWAAIYKRDFLEGNEIRFLPTPGASYQDTGFNFKVWAMARRVYFVKRAFLHYRQDNSNSSVKDAGKIYCVKEEYDEIERYLGERGLMDELGPLVFTCRFGGYIWNMHRLKFKPAMDFTKTVKNDYKRAKKSGYLEVDKLDAVGKYNSKLIAIRHPKLYVFLRPLHDLRNSAKPVASNILKKISPRYRQRLETIKTINKLNEIQSELSVKISEIELKIEEENGKK
ncbi:glycosyltransferase [Candidatus Saccharibacteria bacterium]|nr:glycosyltransferase [Candidatus Saccharibacteria bacterium]MBR3115945.1 glycosyltransferase [Candidatus Saccharibacteria bacterium]